MVRSVLQVGSASATSRSAQRRRHTRSTSIRSTTPHRGRGRVRTTRAEPRGALAPPCLRHLPEEDPSESREMRCAVHGLVRSRDGMCARSRWPRQPAVGTDQSSEQRALRPRHALPVGTAPPPHGPRNDLRQDAGLLRAPHLVVEVFDALNFGLALTVLGFFLRLGSRYLRARGGTT